MSLSSYCAICGQIISPKQQKATHREINMTINSDGDETADLTYVEVAHKDCAKQDMAVSMSYWQWDGKQAACMA